MRWFAYLRATLGGYFWLPCQVCGRMYGGHEKGGGHLETLDGGKMTCPKCPGEWVLWNCEILRPRVIYDDNPEFPGVTMLVEPAASSRRVRPRRHAHHGS